MSSYKVKLKSIKLYGRHGVLEEEKEKGQDFLIDIKFTFNKSNDTDEIEDTVDYSRVYSVAKNIFEAKRYNLLETLVKDIANKIMAEMPKISTVKVSASKEKPPIGGDIAQVSVSIKEKE